jgi:hypothetical protein
VNREEGRERREKRSETKRGCELCGSEESEGEQAQARAETQVGTRSVERKGIIFVDQGLYLCSLAVVKLFPDHGFGSCDWPDQLE